MMQAGVRPAVTMKISGHSTPHIFQSYNIIDELDVHEAVKKAEKHKGSTQKFGGGAIGSTADSDSVNPGSSPGPRANLKYVALPRNQVLAKDLAAWKFCVS